MNWCDIASIVFVCVTANHLGLIKAIESVIDIHDLPIAGCVKCLSFWCVLIYTLVTTTDVISSLAVSFLASYVAIWLELIEGLIDIRYLKIYGKIITANADNTAAADAKCGNSASTVSELQRNCEDNHKTT